MLDWLLQVQENALEPCLKLFSRISLGKFHFSNFFLLPRSPICCLPT
jgi:hypothetical protein